MSLWLQIKLQILHGFLHGHAFIKDAMTYGGLAQSQLSGPISYAKSLSKIINHMIVCFISILLMLRGPSAILFGISFGIFDAINRMFCRGARSHICIEIFKHSPTLTDSEPSLSIIFESLSGWIGAAPQHVMPDGIFWRMAQAMCSGALDCSFHSKAPARLGIAGTQISGRHKYFFSAIADTAPFRTFFASGIIWDILSRQKTAKSPSSEVLCFSHADIDNIHTNVCQGQI